MRVHVHASLRIPMRRRIRRTTAVAAALVITSACQSADQRGSASTSAATSAALSASTSTTAVSEIPTAQLDAPPSTDWSPQPTSPPTKSVETSWPCTFDDSPVGLAGRHAEFVGRIERSDLPEATRTRLTGALPRIEESMWLYCEAERRTGVEALLLAAIHYREANNDPARSTMSGETLGARNPDTGAIEGTDRIDNAIRAAEHIKGNAAAFYRVDLTSEVTPLEVGFAALAYNRGGMYCRVDGLHPMESPYVAGGLIERTVDMAWPAVGGGSIGTAAAWGEPASVRGKPDRRLGVLAIMRGLGSPVLTRAFSFNTAETVPGCR